MFVAFQELLYELQEAFYKEIKRMRVTRQENLVHCFQTHYDVLSAFPGNREDNTFKNIDTYINIDFKSINFND